MFIPTEIKVLKECLKKKKECLKKSYWGHLGGSAVECLPLAQGMIPESQDRVPHWAPCMEPASPSAYVSASLSLSLCVSHE